MYNRRIEKSIDPDGLGSAPAQVERLVYDGDDIALTFDGNGNQTHRYLHGVGVDAIAAAETEGQVRWALSDHQGTVRDVVDSTGIVLNHLNYSSFGEVTSETNPSIDFRYGYTGRDRDEESGLSYYRSRYYDPATGRFLSEDAIGFAGEDTNLYRYVKNHPIGRRDPSGHVDISGDRGGGWVEGALVLIGIGLSGAGEAISTVWNAGTQALSDLLQPAIPETARTGWNQISVSSPADPEDSIYTTPIDEPSGGEIIVTRIPQEVIDRIIRDCFPPIDEGYFPQGGFGEGLVQPSAEDFIFESGFRGPAAREFDWAHIMDRHAPWGKTAQQSGKKTIFEGLTEPQIQRTVTNAWRNRERVETQDDLITGERRMRYRGVDDETGYNVEMWYNQNSKTVESAYPVGRE